MPPMSYTGTRSVIRIGGWRTLPIHALATGWRNKVNSWRPRGHGGTLLIIGNSASRS